MNIRSYFDLQERANLALNCLTGLLDKRRGHLPFFDLLYWTKPPVAVHIRWDYGDCTGRYVEALALMRTMSDSRLNSGVDAELEKLLLSFFGPHGLSWWPASPYPTPHPSDSPGEVAELCWSQAAPLHALTTLYHASGSERYRDLGARLVDGLSAIALTDGAMRFFPVEAARVGRADDILYKRGGWPGREMPRAGWFGAFVGVLIWPLVRFYEATAYERAVELALGFCEYVLRGARVFRSDGRFCDLLAGHFYSRVLTALGLLRTGLVLDRPEYVGMAESIYVHAKEWGTPFGWFPEDISCINGCETCCVTAMIDMAIVLGRHVDPVYWNDAERFGRNQLLENQLILVDWVERLEEDPKRVPPIDPVRTSSDRVMERMLGGFAGWAGMNDWVTGDVHRCHMMGCCNATGARGLHDLWHYSVSEFQGEVSINMLFSKVTADLDVRSRLPYEGALEVRVKNDRSVQIRVPEYVDRAHLKVFLNGKTLPCTLSGPWLRLGYLRAGDIAQMRFDLPDGLEEEFIGYQTYTVRYKGDTVVEISPRGGVHPIYEASRLIGTGEPEGSYPSGRQEVESI